MQEGRRKVCAVAEQLHSGDASRGCNTFNCLSRTTIFSYHTEPMLLYISLHQLLPDSLAHWFPTKPCASPQRTFPSQPALSILVSNLCYKAGPFSRQCLLKTQERAWLSYPYLLLPSHSLAGSMAVEVRLQDSPTALEQVE